MPLFPEVDVSKTKDNAKKILRGYPRWRRIANDFDGQKVTQEYTFIPRNLSSSPSRQVEKLAIRKADALSELEAVEQAVSNLLDPYSRVILFEKYLARTPGKDYTIYSDLGLSESTYYDLLDKALLEFAEIYRNGEQVKILE
ncbi:TPA: ArpU family transcriptional regulator [Streptococcus suis]|uniref:ArpU family phage packaging/lysis transcriptional regulator n=1 Tax=Streptococcus suis TaxID=1307 RepID=UPI00209BA065|nr:ArpU family phage packaging/lysis transcriptional regulator [Streptococcus suis]MCO8199357.1 ArpU family transcriptional regulator [Streptococcus suis]MCO8217086.1 ArpU family transcriptional regulator [Streptococcus suis]HEM3468840.1 ArpU family transcriptional regulator [Streptococcus suis]HEM3479589.1 ArpU family transcriptional regulator [Streptococcus suis]